MDVPNPTQAMAALAAFVRERLGEVTHTLGPALTPLWRRDPHDPAGRHDLPAAVGAARQFATAVVGAAAPFAATSYSRARLIRQMHASGLLTDEQARLTQAALREHESAGDPLGADRALEPPR